MSDPDNADELPAPPYELEIDRRSTVTVEQVDAAHLTLSVYGDAILGVAPPEIGDEPSAFVCVRSGAVARYGARELLPLRKITRLGTRLCNCVARAQERERLA